MSHEQVTVGAGRRPQVRHMVKSGTLLQRSGSEPQGLLCAFGRFRRPIASGVPGVLRTSETEDPGGLFCFRRETGFTYRQTTRKERKENMKKTIAILLCVLMLAGVLAGCGGSGGNTKGGDTAGKTLNFGCQMYSDGLINPASQTNCAWNCMRFGVGEALFKFNDNMEVEPWLAASSATDDYVTWVITLREGVKFSNGTAMTATKVKESLDWVRTEGPNGSSNPQKFLPFEAEVTADDAANTVTIVLPQANMNLPGNLAYPVMEIINVSETKDFDTGVIGTGPYMVSKFTEQVGFTMTKNPNYWDGTVPYDTVEIKFMGDASAKANALKAGDVDLVENITNVADLQSLQADERFTVDVASGVRCGFSWMNQAEGRLLANDTLRQAILMAIDYNAICNSNTIGGLYTPGFSVLPSTLSYGYDKLTNPYEYNLDAAKKLLDDAGIVDTNGDGIRELDGKEIDLTYVSYENRMLNDFSDAHTQYLTELGIKITAKYGSSDDQWNSLVAGEYDFNNNNWTTVGNGDPTEYMANWYSKGGADYCSYVSEEYDALYEELLTEFDNAKRADLICRMQQILIDDAAALVDGYYNSSMAWSKAVGYAHIHTADYYWITTEITPAA